MQLDLVDYACQEVRISFAVTNRIGLSQFSDPVHIIVDGGMYKNIILSP